VKPDDANAPPPADATAASTSSSAGGVGGGAPPVVGADEPQYALISADDDAVGEHTLERPTARLVASEGAGIDTATSLRRPSSVPLAPVSSTTPAATTPAPAATGSTPASVPVAPLRTTTPVPPPLSAVPRTATPSRGPAPLPFASLLPPGPAPVPLPSTPPPPLAFPMSPEPASTTPLPAHDDLDPPTQATALPQGRDACEGPTPELERIDDVLELDDEGAFENVKTTEVSTLQLEAGAKTPSLPSAAPVDAIDDAIDDALDGDATRPIAALPPLQVAAASLSTLPPSTMVPATPSSYDDTPFADEGPGGALDEATADIEIARPHVDQLFSSDDSSKLPTDEGATVEGAPVEDHRTDMGPVPPAAGATLVADDHTVVQLEDSLGEQGGMVFYRARLLRDGADLGQPFTAVWTPQAPPEPAWSHLPDARLVRPRCRVTLERAAVRVFERPRGNTVIDFLADDEKLLGAMQVVELGIELAELLEAMHGAGCHLYDLDPSQIVIEKGGRVRLYAVGGLYSAGQLPRGALGPFCAPEVRRRMSYRIGQAADVYSVALLLYALLAKRAPIEIDTDPSLLVSPRVFRPECPLGIWPLLRGCLELNPMRRVGHARGLRQTLERIKARLLVELKATEDQVPVLLESWAELHTGITKARRGSNQQDRALAVTDESARTGLYVIADGVSRSRYGDGAFAAEQVEVASLQRWTGLEKGGPQALALEHAQRGDILKQISRSAGKKIAAEINARYAPIPNEPNQVMSATLVAAFVVNGDATVGNLGDSRAYLVRDGVIEQISVDHDRTTDALRLGLSFREAANVQMGTALTRVVGRVVIEDDGTCRADPFEPELFRLRLLPGDRLVLCSDGVADFVAGPGLPHFEQDEKIKQTVLDHDDPARAAFELVVLANRVGGYDNISCVVIAVHPA
jgi:serine/threonine protein phosphatase PrpC